MIEALTGKKYGPFPIRVCRENVAEFVDATGDDPNRWIETAPPGWAATALFAVAPTLLSDAALADRSVIHGEQRFEWHQPIVVESLLEVTGTVGRVRERGGVQYIGFEMIARDSVGLVLGGNSLFLVSGEKSPPTACDIERAEPPSSYRGTPEQDQKAASRSDLVRYAAATRDWNPIHWDHAAAVAAGLPGVVVHGLLQSAWAFAAAAARGSYHRPLESARVRFRNPLLPARPVDVGVDASDDGAVYVTVSDIHDKYLDARIVLG